jgi:hypothetical protein
LCLLCAIALCAIALWYRWCRASPGLEKLPVSAFCSRPHKMSFWSFQDHHLHQFLRDNPVSSLPLQSQPVVGALRQSHLEHLGHQQPPSSQSPSLSASSIRILSTASSAPHQAQARPMPPKRRASGSPAGTPAKLPKQETKPETFSNSVKKRLQSSTRTGQACDRCKVPRIISSQIINLSPSKATANTVTAAD